MHATVKGDTALRTRSGGRTTLTSDQVADLVLRAREGDPRAWADLVDAFASLVWSVARSHRLASDDCADVSQAVWLKLFEHIGRLTEPRGVGAWLATTARRESLRVIAGGHRWTLVDDTLLDSLDLTDEPAARSSEAEADTKLPERVNEALSRLPSRSTALLFALTADPQLSYREISQALDVPVGSIGPTRARALAKLRHLLEEPDLVPRQREVEDRRAS